MEQNKLNKRFCPIKMLVIVHIIFHLKGYAARGGTAIYGLNRYVPL